MVTTTYYILTMQTFASLTLIQTRDEQYSLDIYFICVVEITLWKSQNKKSVGSYVHIHEVVMYDMKDRI